MPPPAISAASKSPYFVGILGILTMLGVMIVLFPAALDGQTHWIIDEGGPVETLTAAAYALCMLVFVAKGGLRLPLGRGYAVLLVLLFLLSRELDMHKQFTTMGVFKIDYYLSSDVGTVERGIVIAVLTLVGIAVGRLLWDLDRWWWGLRALDPSMIAITLCVVMMGASNLLDGSAVKLANLYIQVDPDFTQSLTKVEEVFEFGIPLFALLAVISYFATEPMAGD